MENAFVLAAKPALVNSDKDSSNTEHLLYAGCAIGTLLIAAANAKILIERKKSE